jgi:NAD(P)-dependent dehydrogenase (short-subunit alcohol dehydrogenase family)
MDLLDKHVVVTGSGRGIGLALARRFHHEGARAVVLVDVNADDVAAGAATLNAERPGSALALTIDLATRAGNEELVRTARQTFGEIDLFFANAGIGAGGDLLDATDDDWDRSFAINIKAHAHAARALLPEWLERGAGYFCSTASAAGLLTQIGSAPYSVTKHAAVGFAEWLSVTYGDRGINVSCLCPMGVNTAMINSPSDGSVSALSGNVVRSAGAVLEPEDVALIVCDAIRAEQFLILPHPEVLTFLQRKTADYDRWIAGMRRLQSRVASA